MMPVIWCRACGYLAAWVVRTRQWVRGSVKQPTLTRQEAQLADVETGVCSECWDVDRIGRRSMWLGPR